MKHLIIIALSVVLLSSCAQRQLNRGLYDKAIRTSVKKLKKKPADAKHTRILKQAWDKANTQDNDQIKYFKLEGQPDKWDEILVYYNNLKRRQTLVRSLPSVPAGITFSDYDQEIIQAKQRAAAYFYENGKRLLQQDTRLSARQAYEEFQRTKTFYPNYNDVDELVRKAEFEGTNNVLFKMQNTTQLIIPQGFEQDLLRLPVADLNQKWIRYTAEETEGLNYDYIILVNLKVIDVSPERVNQSQYIDKKEVQDGWQYVLDNKGNVMKDSLGNDIKVEKHKTITCVVNETALNKVARVAGTIDYINNRTNELIRSEPIAADNIFQHSFAFANGDMNALTPQSLNKIKSQPLPFPPDADMLLQAGATLKGMVKDIVFRNRGILQN